MNEQNNALAKQLVNDSYLSQGFEAGIQKRRNAFKALLSNRRLPPEGWDDATIEMVLSDLALMDSNNFQDNVGAGEREARIFSQLVAKRHYRFGHGIGRSGDIAEIQPKAAGSSLLHNLTRHFVKDALRIAGLDLDSLPLILPVATGMSITLTLLCLKSQFPERNMVVWPRIDQKSCLKAIYAAGCEPVVVENRLEGDSLVTDLEAVEQALLWPDGRGAGGVAEEEGRESAGPEEAGPPPPPPPPPLAVVTTASCFAPRRPDDLEGVARLCAARGVAHVVNNAYGLQCRATTRQLARACRVGRVDYIVQSTDKNFLVPVGGAVVASPDPGALRAAARTWPGRAGAAPLQDMFITLTSMGSSGYQGLLEERERLRHILKEELSKLAADLGERVLEVPGNTISFGLTLGGTAPAAADATYLGAMLFKRCVSGTRVVTGAQSSTKQVGNSEFQAYGAHCNAYPYVPYLTAACAIGMSEQEVYDFCHRLHKTINEFKKKRAKKQQQAPK